MPAAAPLDSPHPSRSITVDGKKFLWDGNLFESHEDAARQAEKYENDNFEVHLLDEGNRCFVYSRRFVKQVVVTAS